MVNIRETYTGIYRTLDSHLCLRGADSGSLPLEGYRNVVGTRDGPCLVPVTNKDLEHKVRLLSVREVRGGRSEIFHLARYGICRDDHTAPLLPTDEVSFEAHTTKWLQLQERHRSSRSSTLASG